MWKSILTVLCSWLLSFGIYHEDTVAYVSYYILAVLSILLMILGTVGILITDRDALFEAKADIIAHLNISSFVKMCITAPVLLYAIYMSSSWNTLAVYVGVFVATGIFISTVFARSKIKFN